jgi:hypothetical protein
MNYDLTCTNWTIQVLDHAIQTENPEVLTPEDLTLLREAAELYRSVLILRSLK